jgi:hypothetical protein
VKSKAVLSVMVATLSVVALTGCSSSSDPVSSVSPKPTKSASASPSESAVPSASPSAPVASATPSAGSSTPSAPAPAPTKTAAPVPSASPTVKTTVLNIGADALVIKNPDHTTFGTYSYRTSPVATIAALTKVYGHEPKVRYTGEPQMCSGGVNIYTWNNIALSFYSTTKDPASVKQYSVQTNGANTTYEFIVQAPNGAQVGNSMKKLIAANPTLPKQEIEYKGVKYVDLLVDHTQVQESYDNSTAGAVASSENDVVKSIVAPTDLYADC